MTAFDEAIAAASGQAFLLTTSNRRELIQGWREVYAVGLHAATGKWIKLGYDWHVFSYGHARALARNQAEAVYAQLPRENRTIVCPHDNRLSAYEIVGGHPPDFRTQGLDITIWSADLAWTMAFTHEDGWLGPYFSRRVWVDP